VGKQFFGRIGFGVSSNQSLSLIELKDNKFLIHNINNINKVIFIFLKESKGVFTYDNVMNFSLNELLNWVSILNWEAKLNKE
jgi:hypothetical protein